MKNIMTMSFSAITSAIYAERKNKRVKSKLSCPVPVVSRPYGTLKPVSSSPVASEVALRYRSSVQFSRVESILGFHVTS